jgi:hypothetical protein
MANNIIKYNSRITLKYDTLSNWRPNGTWINFTPLKGEVCIIDPAEDLGPGAACLIKIGNGKDSIGTLNYLSATAADVYDWAKLSATDIVTLLNTGTVGTGENKITLTQSFATDKELADAVSVLEEAIGGIGDAVDALGESLTKHPDETSKKSETNKFISHIDYNETANEATVYYTSVQFPTVDGTLNGSSNNAIANKAVYTETQTIRDLVNTLTSDFEDLEDKVSNAMHFLGITSTVLSDGAKTNPITINGKTVTLTEEDAGAVVLSAAPASGTIQYEYVWTGSAWGQLGQEGSFAVKGTITHSDIADNAAIEQTKIASTLGKTNLAGDISDIDTRLDAIEGKNNTQDSEIGILERDTWKTVTRNKVTQVDDNTNGNFTTGLQDSEGNSTLNKSDLTIGTDVIGYIIWDCGSASKNI